MKPLLRIDGAAEEVMTALSTGKTNFGFSETVESKFLHHGNDWHLLVDDFPLPTSVDAGRKVWTWIPGFYAGAVRAELLRNGADVGVEYLFDVTPDPAKVGHEIFQQLVRDVWNFDPGLVIGHEAAQTKIGQSRSFVDVQVAYSRIAAHADSFLASLANILADPNRTSRHTRRLVQLHSVRRADARTATALARSNFAVAVLDIEDSSSNVNERNPPLLDIPVSELSFDSAANRALAYFLKALASHIDWIYAGLRSTAQNERDERVRGELLGRLPRRFQVLDRVKGALANAQQRVPLSEVTRAELSGAGLTGISRLPKYARGQQVIWKMMRPGFGGESVAEWSSMSPTWAIYESWCFVKLQCRLTERFCGWDKKVRSPKQGRYEICWTKADREVRVSFQVPASYSAGSAGGMRSISMQLIPDIVLSSTQPNSSKWFVLDAKYRRGRQNVLDAMRSAHLYHDALRLDEMRSSLSMLLVPVEPKDTFWLREPEFIAKERVGVVAIPPLGADEAMDFLLEMLDLDWPVVQVAV